MRRCLGRGVRDVRNQRSTHFNTWWKSSTRDALAAERISWSAWVRGVGQWCSDPYSMPMVPVGQVDSARQTAPPAQPQL